MFWLLSLLGFIALLLFLISQRLDWILAEIKKNNGWIERFRDGQQTAHNNQRETIGLLEDIRRGQETTHEQLKNIGSILFDEHIENLQRGERQPPTP